MQLQRTSEGRSATNRDALRALGRQTIDYRAAGASLSGNERNHLFVSDQGRAYADISGVSGLDDQADGRAFAILDYDRDGWPDVALVNANNPLFELFRNRVACRQAQNERGHMIALRLVGGNDTPSANAAWSNRDGIGAMVTLTAANRSIVREFRAGEGLAAQNSSTMLIGIGRQDVVSSVKVAWPSGKVSMANAVAAGSLLTVYENPAQSPNREAVLSAPYAKRSPDSSTDAISASAGPLFPAAAEPSPSAPLRVYTTMATWCAACLGELPVLRRLRATFGPEQLAMYGVPIDPKDSTGQLQAWSDRHQPPYGLLTETNASAMRAVGDLVLEQLGMEAVPATFVTDSSGRILLSLWGPPSISAIRSLLRTVENRARPADSCTVP